MYYKIFIAFTVPIDKSKKSNVKKNKYIIRSFDKQNNKKFTKHNLDFKLYIVKNGNNTTWVKTC